MVERAAVNRDVVGSSPTSGANNPEQIGFLAVLTQSRRKETSESESANVKYPKRIKHRDRILATIYAKCKGHDSYRVAWQVHF